jgi:hypothetical protein
MLDYQDARKRRRVVLHRAVRIAIFVVTSVLALIVAWSYGLPKVVEIVNRRRLISGLPAGTVIYSNAPTIVAQFRSHPDYFLLPIAPWRPRLQVTRLGPSLLDPARPWQRPPFRLGPWQPPCDTLECPGREKRLVALSVDWECDHDLARVQFPLCLLFPLSGLSSRKQEALGILNQRESWVQLGAGEGLTVYAGHADPNDPTHMIIDYDIDGKKGIIDGWLKPNDTMSFSIRSGPATTRPSQGFTDPPRPVTP